jgi:hypothetical protein
MEEKPTDAKAETLIGRLKDLVGLPGGKAADDADEAREKDTVPEDGLTAPGAKGLPPHAGTGIKVQD